MKQVRYRQISEPALRELLMASHCFHALESWGVDNWEGYGDAMKNYLQDCSVIDETTYEYLEDVVETDVASFPICNCPQEEIKSFDDFCDTLEF